MLDARNVRVRSLDTTLNEISWEVGPEEDVLDYTFQVLRSESAEGPFDAISEEFEDRYLFMDRRLPQGLTYRKLWYRIRVRRKRDNAIWESPSVRLGAEATVDARYMRNVEGVLFNRVIGRQVWLFKRRTFGVRCNCFDCGMQKVVRTNCLECYGVGFLRGYHNPIEVSMQIDPEGASKINHPMQQDTKPMTSFRMSYYPDINPGDIVVEGENVRWKVDTIQKSERARATVMQSGSLFRIQPTDIEYNIPINTDLAWRDIQPTPKQWFKNSKQLDEVIDQRLPNLFGGFTRES